MIRAMERCGLFLVAVSTHWETEACTVDRKGHPAEKVVGILGGMGPAATLDLLAKVLQHTPAAKDQDHLRVLVDMNPKVPDRVAALLEGGADPGPVLVEMARGLERAGAQVLAIPCNTAHCWHSKVQAAVSVPVLHIVAETARHLAGMEPRPRVVGLLASTGLVKVGLYQDMIGEQGISVCVPDPVGQEVVMQVIYEVKAGRETGKLRPLLDPVLEELTGNGAAAVIAGCTELPLVLCSENSPLPVIDPTDLLARAVVREALCLRGGTESAGEGRDLSERTVPGAAL